ncbi:MAG TPA: MFS transporter [Thermomicrobiales bacterium]|nr:MFS transporter [Thermomicrobiales bacterium]
MTAKSGAGFRRDRPTWLAYLALCYFAYLQAALGPAMPFLRADLGFSVSTASLHFAAAAAGGVVVGFAGQGVIRRIGRRNALWLGMVGMGAGTLLLVFAAHPVQSIVGAGLTGLLGSFVLIASQAGLADHHGEARAVAMAESNMLASGSAVAAAILVGSLGATPLGWRAALVLPLPYGAALGLVFRGAWLRAPAPSTTARVVGPIRFPARFWLVVAVLVCGTAVEWSISYWGADFLVGAHGLPAANGAMAMSAFFGGMIVGRAAGARLSRSLAPTRLLPAALLVAVIGFPVLWLAPIGWMAVAGLAVAGLGIANVYPLSVSAAAAEAPGRTDQAIARVAVGAAGAILLAPLALGAVASAFGLAAAFGLGSPFLLAALALASIAARCQRPSAGDPEPTAANR